MSDIYRNETTGDIDLTNNLVRLTVSDAEEVRQKVEIRLRTFKGEWFMNINAGVPYFQSLLKKGVSKSLIDTQIKTVTLATVGVIAIASFDSVIDLRQRTYTTTMTVTTSEGPVVIEFTP